MASMANNVLEIMKTAHIWAVAMMRVKSATRRMQDGLAAGEIAHQVFTSMIHQPSGHHGAAN
jgi:hypothetical protein